MALEHRNGRVYYYRSRRIGKRVRKEYQGAGYPATLMAQLDGIDRDRKDYADWEKQEKRERRRKWCAGLREALGRANQIIADALSAAGWHQHKREWRKRRGVTMTTDLATVIGTWTPDVLERQAGPLAQDVANKAAKGDRSTLPAVRQYLDNPAAVALWGDPGRTVLERWVKLYARTDLVTEEAMFRHAQALRESLTGPNPTALDALLAERVVLAWVTLSVLEGWQARMVQGWIEKPTVKPETMLNVFAPHVDYAHRQFMAACRTLAKVRRVKLPDVLALVNVNTSVPIPQPAVPVEAATPSPTR